MTVLLVALGAAVGAPCRYLVGQMVATPWGTLLVNVAGSLILGFVVGLPVSAPWQALLGTGFCGALTTYSTFSFETFSLARASRRRLALAYAVLSILAGLTAAYAGRATAQAL